LARSNAAVLMVEAEGFEPCPMVLRTPRLEWWTARDLRSLLADRVRSRPPWTSGSWCRADPARTSILTEWRAADQKSPPRNLGTRDTACPDSPAQSASDAGAACSEPSGACRGGWTCGPEVAPSSRPDACLLSGLRQLADEDTADDGQDCADDKRPDPGPDRGGNQFGLLPNVLDALLDVEVVGDGHDPGDGASDDGGSLQQGGQVGRGELGSHRSGW